MNFCKHYQKNSNRMLFHMRSYVFLIVSVMKKKIIINSTYSNLCITTMGIQNDYFHTWIQIANYMMLKDNYFFSCLCHQYLWELNWEGLKVYCFVNMLSTWVSPNARSYCNNSNSHSSIVYHISSSTSFYNKLKFFMHFITRKVSCICCFVV